MTAGMKGTLFNTIRHRVRYWLLDRLPTCKTLAPLMSQSLERRLTLRERVVLQSHVLVCAWCAWYLEHLGELRDQSRARGVSETAGEAVPSTILSPEARERIRRSLEGR